MKATFNVLNQAWIPVVDLEGNRSKLGLREVFERAHELREVSDASPMEEFGLYRFLGVFLMDALRPETETDLEDFLKEGRFDMAQIDGYIAQCQSEGVSFDLFDEKRPFLQSVYDEASGGRREPVSKLDYTVPSGNNHIHFDHREVKNLSFSYEKAIRALIAAYVFAYSEGSGYAPGINGKPPYMVVVRGNTLYETLINQLVPTYCYENIDDPPPFWRTTSIDFQECEFYSTSLLFGLLFPSRRISLIPGIDSETVSSVYYGSGFKYKGNSWNDPAVACWVGGKPAKRHTVIPDKNKHLWRNIAEFLNDDGKYHFRPKIISQACDRCSDSTALLRVTLYGMETESSAKKVRCVRHDFDFPVFIFQDSNRGEIIADLISDSEQLAIKLAKVMRMGIQDEEAEEELKRKKGKEKKDNTIVEDAMQFYWNKCEQTLMRICTVELTAKTVNRQECRRKWIEDIVCHANKSVDRLLENVRLSSKKLCKFESSRYVLAEEIKRLRKEATK